MPSLAATTVPTPTKAENLAQFVIGLEENINNGRFQAIDKQFAHLFYVSLIPAVLNNLAIAAELEHRYLPQGATAVQFSATP